MGDRLLPADRGHLFATPDFGCHGRDGLMGESSSARLQGCIAWAGLAKEAMIGQDRTLWLAEVEGDPATLFRPGGERHAEISAGG
jgi:hypothetical protein